MNALLYLLIALLGYLIGSVPVGLIVGRVAGVDDVRKHGSKRTGATNIVRTLGPVYGVLVFIADVFKGFGTVLLARQILPDEPWAWAIGALMSMIGHIYPVFARFQGGRGVATAVGGVLGLVPWAFVAAFLVWWAVVLPTRYASLGSMCCGVATVIVSGVLLALGQAPLAGFVYCIVITVIILVSHRENIARLRAGTESKFGQRVQVKQ